MLGFIKKDLLMIKGNLKVIVVCLLVFLLMAFNDQSDFSFVPAFISVMIMISTFSYDEYNKTDAYVITLPNGRINAIKAKYIATFLVTMISIILTIICSVFVGIIKNNLVIEDIFSSMFGCFLGILIILCIIYPIIYKFGVEKSRIGLFLGIFAVVFIISLVFSNIKLSEDVVDFLNNYWMILLSGISLIGVFISYNISKHIYLHKEF